MNWIKYDIHTTTQDADLIAAILTECGITGFEITDHVPLTEKEEKQMYTDIPADTGPDDGSAILTFYTEAPGNTEKTFYSTGSSLRDDQTEPDTPCLPPEEMVSIITQHILAQKTFAPIPIPKITFEIQDDSLWNTKWKENFKPFYVAEDILIKPTWEETPAETKPDDIVIEMDPGSAFGTGTHETTKLCLLTLRKYITPETKILDAGCGSGILAIAALLCGADSALCLDIDPAAVRSTKENMAANHIENNRICAMQENILENSDALQKKYGNTFDIAVANILADVIIPLSEYIGTFLKKDGIFIASGILAEKADAVETALSANHFDILEKNTMGEWVSYVAKPQ
ncbi:MAG: 50S ribosomal protein L11 methyltransferase [Clostridiaceae bacterium]|nr:50S ribosomal protein L11 methyltransferase [Clostridiaceae bacterium]